MIHEKIKFGQLVTGVPSGLTALCQLNHTIGVSSMFAIYRNLAVSKSDVLEESSSVEGDKLGGLFRRIFEPCTTMDNFKKSLPWECY